MYIWQLVSSPGTVTAAKKAAKAELRATFHDVPPRAAATRWAMPHDMAVLAPNEAMPTAFCDREIGGAGGGGGACFFQSDSRPDKVFLVGRLGALGGFAAALGAGSARLEVV
jgi:hypothetical protein